MKSIGLGLLLSSILIINVDLCSKNKGSPISAEDTSSAIINGGFEADGSTQTPQGWRTNYNSDASHTIEGGHTGQYCLEQEKSAAYKVYTYQTLVKLASGYYSLSAWVRNGGGQNACYLFAKDYGDVEKMTSLPVSNTWTQVVVRGIHVTNGKCTLGLYSDADAGDWCQMDDVQFIEDGIPYTFLKGGDISELSYIESKGGVFYDSGVAKDCLQILRDHGFNIVRLRLYNDPGNPNYSPSNRLPAGFQNPTDILNLARRSKAMGFEIELTFYYSDYWSNGIPHDWDSLNVNGLDSAVYAFTYNFMEQMQAQGTTPEYVSLGNEIQGGILLPCGSSRNFARLSQFLKQGYNAVKAVSPSTQVILHLDDAGNSAKYDWFFKSCQTYGVQYDLIGASYYPYWTKRTVAQVHDWANRESAKVNKNIIIMETGYNWNPTLPSGSPGQLQNNGPYDTIYPSSPAGQRDFLYACFTGLKAVNNGRVVGDLYWDPIMIAVPGVGWELGAPNVVANTTLFDFNGNALPAFRAFQYNN